MCAGAGRRSRFRRKVPKVPEGYRVCWCRFRRQGPEGFGGFRCVCWCRFRKQVPASCGELRRVPVRAGVGRFWRVPVCWCRFRSSSGIVCVGVGGSGGFRCVLVQEVLEGSSVCWCRFGFRRVPASSGVCWCRFRGKFRKVRRVLEGSQKVLEGSGVCWCRFQRQVPQKKTKHYGVVCCLASLTEAAM